MAIIAAALTVDFICCGLRLSKVDVVNGRSSRFRDPNGSPGLPRAAVGAGAAVAALAVAAADCAARWRKYPTRQRWYHASSNGLP